MHRARRDGVDHRADVTRECVRVERSVGSSAAPVAAEFHHDHPSAEHGQDLGVVVGYTGEARDEDDGRATVVPARVEVIDAGATVVDEAELRHEPPKVVIT